MASDQSIVDFIVEQMAAAKISSKKMFGEHALYRDGKVVALICDDQLFVKPTKAGEKFIKKPIMAPAYPGAKPSFLISGDKWDDQEWLCELIKITASELPMPKKKTAKKK